MKLVAFKLALASEAVAAAFTTISAETQARVDVLFRFMAGSIACPAGTYSVERDPYGPFVSLKSPDSRQAFHWTLGPRDVATPDLRIAFRFDKLDQTCTLTTVQYRSLINSRLASGAQRY